jgi:hypothetical protein
MIILADFSLYVAPKIKIAKTEIWEATVFS